MNAQSMNVETVQPTLSLGDDLAQMRRFLGGEDGGEETDTTDIDIEWRSPRVQQLNAALGLSSFECCIVLLCAAMVLESNVAKACQGSEGNRPAYPTLGLALQCFPRSHWSAIAPGSPLRAWRLIELADETDLLNSRIFLDERILHHLMDLDALDQRLMPYLSPLYPSEWLPRTLSRQCDQIHRALTQTLPPVIQLCGASVPDQISLAATVCARFNVGLFQLSLTRYPDSVVERDNFNRLWRRENRLAKRALMVVDLPDNTMDLAPLLEGISPVFVATEQTLRLGQGARPVLKIPVNALNFDEQTQVLQRLFSPEDYRQLEATHRRVAGQSQLSLQSTLAAGVGARSAREQGECLESAFWGACQNLSRPQLSALAQEIMPKATWDELVLPPSEKQLLSTIAQHVRHAYQVYFPGGFAEKSSRGLGVSALFFGESGTGKTFAAEVLANELNLALYRIDLSAVVSKYIGETEKNLKAIFDAAEQGGAILLFDEADALFGKRSEVRDSHDRYANIEVGYLLQRMEAFRGLAILTTNLKNSLDKAFMRRIRFAVEFPFPGAAERSAIWQRVFPAATSVDNLDWKRLAKLNIAGGHIRNIALNAAFLAVEEGGAVAMDHIYAATRIEYAKLERLLTATELGGSP